MRFVYCFSGCNSNFLQKSNFDIKSRLEIVPWTKVELTMTLKITFIMNLLYESLDLLAYYKSTDNICTFFRMEMCNSCLFDLINSVYEMIYCTLACMYILRFKPYFKMYKRQIILSCIRLSAFISRKIWSSKAQEGILLPSNSSG